MAPNCTRTQLDIASRPGNTESDSTSDTGFPVGKDRERWKHIHTHTHTHQLRWSAGKQAFANSATQLCLRSVSERNLWANRFWRKSRSVLLKAFYSQKQHSCEQAAGSFLSKLLLFNPLKRFHKQPRHCQELWIALL